MSRPLGPLGTDVGTESVSVLGLRSRYERTNGRTNEEVTHVSHKSSRSDTCAHVQDFDDSADRSRTLRAGRLAAHKGEDAEVGK